MTFKGFPKIARLNREIIITEKLDGTNASLASPSFMNPEGVIIFHTAAKAIFKVTLERDDEPKSHHSAAIKAPGTSYSKDVNDTFMFDTIN